MLHDNFLIKLFHIRLITATTGKPLPLWTNYDPSMPKYFYITHDHDSFLPVTWKRDCYIFDRIEEEGVIQSF